MLLRRINASHLCTAVGCVQFRKQSRKFQMSICLKVIIPFSIIVCCLVVTWYSKNVFWVNWNGEARAPSPRHSDGTGAKSCLLKCLLCLWCLLMSGYKRLLLNSCATLTVTCTSMDQLWSTDLQNFRRKGRTNGLATYCNDTVFQRLLSTCDLSLFCSDTFNDVDRKMIICRLKLGAWLHVRLYAHAVE